MSSSDVLVIGYDGSDAAARAVREAGGLLSGRPALVVVVWKAGLGWELVELPATSIGLPPAPIDVRTAVEIDQAMAERAQKLAEQSARAAREAVFEADGLAVAEDVETPIAETIVSLAGEREAAAIVMGAHGHGRLSEVILGGTSREVIRRAPAPSWSCASAS
jgi:nucleotide-binding universal stress UspA family protein